ncbi:FRG domain-containing protein [Lacinutrix algicola]|uniref:FRG domain-containing protein n=1 Tax=Lacinutrix algicola TaxID=342954 RepID=UPI0006E1D1AC|nr:FRG domain-containing protein [Lacinutrix algicola]
MKEVDTSSNLNSRIKLFADWLNNGGVKTIWSNHLLEDLIKVKFRTDGTVDESTVSSVVRAALLAYEGTQWTPPHSSIELMTEYETTLQKALFFEQVMIDTKEDFDSIYEEHKNSESTLYRGVTEAKWRIYSSLQRYWINEKLYENGTDYKTFIEKTISNAKKQNGGILEKFFKNNGISPENDIAVLSFLQHYGCPTPLVDWSNNFKNALYFATENVNEYKDDSREIDKYFSIYHIEEKDLISTSLVSLVEKGISEMEKHVKDNVIQNGQSEGIEQTEMEKFFGRDRLKMATKMLHQNSLIKFVTKIERLITFPLTYFSDINEENDIQFSLNNSMNIINQEGVFIWNSNPFKPIEQVGNEQFGNKEDVIYRFSKCYNINKKLTDYVKDKIRKEGINSEFIYPDPNLIAKNSFEETKASC